MKETSFIDQNKGKWQKFENAYKANTHNPEELSNLFVEITEDLSYARTHYPKRTVRVYLNNLAQDVFTSLYRIKNRPFARFIAFWTKSLPLEAYRMRKDMLIALLIFLISATIGVVSTANDPDEYAGVILGQGYVQMTDEHIAEYFEQVEQGKDPGSPLKVYDRMDAWPMFSYIFFNNIRVGFFMFVLGVIFGLGTLFFLVYNGIMVGTFQSYFYFKGLMLKKSLLYTTFLTIWVHGAFEITAIVLSAACGFSLGRSIMFPKTMTRLQSLQQGAKRGLKVFIGLSVFILIAAILESWVTRQYNMPEWGKLTIILGSFLIMLLVFVLIPFMVARKYPNEIEINENPSFNAKAPFVLYAIRHISEVMTDTFRLFRRHYDSTFGILYKFVLPLSFVFLYFTYQHNEYFFNDSIYWYLNCSLVFGVEPFTWLAPVLFWPLITGVFMAHIFYHILKKEDPEFDTGTTYFPFMLKRGLELALLFTPISLVYQFAPGWVMIVIMFVLPIYFPVFYAVCHAKGNFFARAGVGFNAGVSGYGNGIAVYWLIFFLSAIFFTLLTSQVYYLTEEFLRWHLETRFEYFQAILQIIKSCFFILFYFHMIKLFMVAFTLIYYHISESQTSKGLYDKLDMFGRNNKYYETQTED